MESTSYLKESTLIFCSTQNFTDVKRIRSFLLEKHANKRCKGSKAGSFNVKNMLNKAILFLNMLIKAILFLNGIISRKTENASIKQACNLKGDQFLPKSPLL